MSSNSSDTNQPNIKQHFQPTMNNSQIDSDGYLNQMASRIKHVEICSQNNSIDDEIQPPDQYFSAPTKNAATPFHNDVMWPPKKHVSSFSAPWAASELAYKSNGFVGANGPESHHDDKRLLNCNPSASVTSTVNVLTDDQFVATIEYNVNERIVAPGELNLLTAEQRHSLGRMQLHERRKSHRQRTIVRKFQKLDPSELTSTPAPDVKIGQRVAYKEYYGNEFGTIRWIGRVPQISPNWTVGVEFDNAIGEGDGSLNGRRYFIAKDCFAKFLPLDHVALVDQHVGRPEPGTMISVMSAAVRPGQMISIQRVSTVHVQHCFLNAPHRRPGAEFLAVNTRLHCQCPNCGPCAHVVKPPRTQRLRSGKNATHMCQFSTYTCCGMESQEEALCTYTGNKISSTPPPLGFPPRAHTAGLPPIGNSWIEGAGYLTNLQAEQSKLMPEEYRLGAAPEDIGPQNGGGSKASSRRGSGKHHYHHHASRHLHGSNDASPISKPDDECMHGGPIHHQQRLDGVGKKSLASPPCDNHFHQEPKLSPPIYTDLKEDIPTNCKETTNESSKNDGDRVGWATNYNELAVANLDKTPPQLDMQHISGKGYELADLGNGFGAQTEAYEGAVVVVADSRSARDVNEIDKQQSLGSEELGGARVGVGPKTAKVLHRDSIENRYLFPTDDVIDSTLEADLENLSQARYGQCTGARQHGSARSILRSLRSLVSCLSAKSNHSEFERHSENTLRITEGPTIGLNKSRPIREDNNGVACCGCGRCQSGDYSNLAHSQHQEIHHSTSYVAINSKKIQPLMLPKLVSCSEDNFASAKQDSNLEFENSFISANAHSLNNHQPLQQQQYHYSDCRHKDEAIHGHSKSNNGSFHQRKHGSSGTSSSYGCWSSCGGLGNGERKTKVGAAIKANTVERIRRHISSSSDCGFSSASQNSINLASSLPSCSHINSVENEQWRRNQIYKKIAARLISSTASITDEDLLKLKNSLFNMHSASCCLHTAFSDTVNQVSKTTFDTNEVDQILADIIKRKCQEDSMHQHRHVRHATQEVEPEKASDGVKGDLELDRDESLMSEHEECVPANRWKQTDNESNSDELRSKTFREDSKCTTDASKETKISLEAEGTNPSVATNESAKIFDLPQAFELKLTLTINSEKENSKKKHDQDGATSASVAFNGLVDLNQDGTKAGPEKFSYRVYD